MGLKYSVNENFFKKWSFGMSYVLGYLYADGSLEDASYLRGKYIRVSSTDEESIIRIKKQLGSAHKIVETAPVMGNRKKQYFLRIGSHTLYDDLIKLGMFPKKSLLLEFPNIPKKYLSSFTLGYFDGDGCVLVRKGRNSNKEWILKGLRVVFTCGNKKFLEQLAIEINKELGTRQLKVYNGQRSFMLAYSTEDSIKIFKFFYNNKREGFLKRKYEKFCAYFKLRPSRMDSEIRKIMGVRKAGRVAK